MSAMKSDLAESLTRNEAAITRNEVAIAQSAAAAEQRHKDTYKVIMFAAFAIVGFTIAAVGVGVAFISVYLQLLVSGG